MVLIAIIMTLFTAILIYGIKNRYDGIVLIFTTMIILYGCNIKIDDNPKQT
jgi:ABC-type transport system involved in multi-copper enzyme maturation permease subunit